MADDPKKPTPSTDKPGAGTSDKESGTSRETAPTKTGRKLSPVVLIVSALVSLVVFLGVFSYMMGVFDKKPAPPAAPTETTTGQADSAAASTSHYYTPFGKAAAGLAAALDSNAVDTAARISEFEQRKRELAMEEARLASEKQELTAMKAQIEQLLAKKDAIAGEKVQFMAKLLDGMKPEELTPLMTKLDNNTILAVLPNMKPQNASKVLALLPPERAAEITTQLLSPKP